jgi:hypothetical protein
MRGHSGGGLLLGHGFPIVSSTKQKLNTWSSIETEIRLHASHLLDLVFYEVAGLWNKGQRFFKDNKSSIMLENNGKVSSSKRTKHINIRYFLLPILLKRTKYQWSGVPQGA